MIGQRGDDRAARVHLVSERGHQARVFGNIDVHAGAEADEPEPLPPGKPVALRGVAENAPGDEPGDLYAGDVGASLGSQPQGVALVFFGSLVESAVDETPGMVPALLNLAVHR